MGDDERRQRTVRERMGSRGIWAGTDGMTAGETAVLAGAIESLGYGAWWVPEAMGREVFVLASTWWTRPRRW